MSIAKAAERFDLVRLLSDEGAKLPPAKEPEAVDDWFVAEWLYGTSTEEARIREWHRAAREWMSVPQPVRVQPVGVIGNHGRAREAARPASFGIPYGYRSPPIQQVPRYNLREVSERMRGHRADAVFIDVVEPSIAPHWGQLVGRLNRTPGRGR